MKFEFFDALAGAGKTYAAARQAHRLAKAGKKVAIIQPTKMLLDATLNKELLPLAPKYPINFLHGESVADEASVVVTITKHLTESVQRKGEILGMTHAAFLLIPYWHLRENWIIIFDEVMSVSPAGQMNIPDTHFIITQHLMVTEYDVKYAEVQANEGGLPCLEKIARNKHEDEVYGYMRDFASYVVSGNFQMFVISEQYNKIVTGQYRGTNALLWFGLLRPVVFEGFQRVIIMSALMQQQLLYQLWALAGVEWAPVNSSWYDTLRYTKHSNGETMTCYYAGNGSWSKQGRDEIDKNGVRQWDKITNAVLKLVGDAKTIWMTNRDTDLDGWCTSENITQLPNTPHGINSYQEEYHTCVVTSALNTTPAHAAFLKSRGIDSEELATAIYRSAVYQAWMRSSARNPKCAVAKRLVVMDFDTACWIADLFPGMKVEPIPGLAMRQRRHGRPVLTADQKIAHRGDIKQALLAGLSQLNGDCLPLSHSEFLTQPFIIKDVNSEMRTDMLDYFSPVPLEEQMASLAALDAITNDGEKVEMQCFADIHKSMPFYTSDISSHDDMISFLKTMASQWIAQSKHDVPLTSPAVFRKVDGAETDRGLDNVAYLYGIWLDCDGGDMSSEEFASLFPYLRLAIYATYSSTPEMPKWRCFIPTSHVMTPSIHACFIQQILTVLNEKGYWSDKQLDANKKIKSRKRHGLDSSKFTASSLFLLPCRAADRVTYFRDYDDAIRAPLDVLKWVECSILDDRPETKQAARLPRETAPELLAGKSPELQKLIRAMDQNGLVTGHNEVLVQHAINTWTSTTRGNGFEAFFDFAKDLQNACMDEYEIEQMLRRYWNASGSNGNDRRKEIPSIMRAIRKRGTLFQRHGNSRR